MSRFFNFSTSAPAHQRTSAPAHQRTSAPEHQRTIKYFWLIGALLFFAPFGKMNAQTGDCIANPQSGFNILQDPAFNWFQYDCRIELEPCVYNGTNVMEIYTVNPVNNSIGTLISTLSQPIAPSTTFYIDQSIWGGFPGANVTNMVYVKHKVTIGNETYVLTRLVQLECLSTTSGQQIPIRLSSGSCEVLFDLVNYNNGTTTIQSISWGDGTTYSGTPNVQPNSGAFFGHTYVAPGGSYTVVVSYTKIIGGVPTLMTDTFNIIVFCPIPELDFTIYTKKECSRIPWSAQGPVPSNNSFPATYTWQVNGVTVLQGTGSAFSSLNNQVIQNINTYLVPGNQIPVTLIYQYGTYTFTMTNFIDLWPEQGYYIGRDNYQTTLGNLQSIGLWPNNTLSGLTPNIGQTRVVVDGELIINPSASQSPANQYSFEEMDFHMCPCSQIKVQTNKTLLVNITSFQAKADVMWQGFVVEDNARFRLEESSISDARYAVAVPDRATLEIIRNQFVKNYIGVYIQPRTTPRSIMAVFRTNLFTSGDGDYEILPHCSKQPEMGNFAYAGVVMHDLTGFPPTFDELPETPPGGNNFYNLANGVLMNNINTTVIMRRTAFYDIGLTDVSAQTIVGLSPLFTRPGGVVGAADGFGIYFENPREAVGTLLFTGLRGINPKDDGRLYDMTFVNNRNPFYVKDVNVRIRDVDSGYRGAAVVAENGWLDNGENQVDHNFQDRGFWSRGLLQGQTIDIQNSYWGGSDATVNDYTFRGFERGIQLTDMQSGTVIIRNNIVQSKNGTHINDPNSGISSAGIIIEGAKTNPFITVPPTSVTVEANWVEERCQGIFSAGLTNPFILNNYVRAYQDFTDLTDPVNDQFYSGITTLGCVRPTISCNEVVSSTDEWMNDGFKRHFGYRFEMNENAMISCNSANRIRTGQYFVGPNNNTVLETNIFRNHRRGLWLSPTVIMGQQIVPFFSSNSNTWLNEINPDPENAPAIIEFAPGSTPPQAALQIDANQFFVETGAVLPPLSAGNQSSLASGSYHPLFNTGWDPNSPGVPVMVWPSYNTTNIDQFIPQWFRHVPGLGTQDCAEEECVPIVSGTGPDGTPVGGHGLLDSTDMRIALGDTLVTEFRPEVTTILRDQLYHQLVNTPDSLQQNPIFSAFRSNYETSPEGQLAELMLNSNASTNSLTQFEHSYSILQSEMLSYFELQNTWLSQMGGSIEQEVAKQAMLNKGELIVSLQNALAVNLQALTTQNSIEANEKLAFNTDINPDKEIHLIQQAVNEIRFQYALVDSFTNDQESVLSLVSAMCPIVGGPSVYDARTMYHLLHPNAVFNDREICDAAGVQYKKQNMSKLETFLLKITPNPSSDLITVSGFEGDGFINIVDILGRSMMEVQIANASNVVLDIKSLPSGTYFVRFFGNGVNAQQTTTIIKR